MSLLSIPPSAPVTTTSLGISGILPNTTDTGFDIILLAGQSNMCGRGTNDQLIDVPDPRLFQFGGYPSDTRFQQIYEASEGLSHPQAQNTTQVGPGLQLGKHYLMQISPTRRVLLVPTAWGGTSIVNGPWQASARTAAQILAAPPTVGTGLSALYENAIYQANLAIRAALNVSPNSRFVGIAWHQGETDGDNAQPTATYLAALQAVVAGFRAQIAGASNCWFVMGEIHADSLSNSVNYQAIDAAHVQALTTISKSGLGNNVPSTMPNPNGGTALTTQNGDNLHYNALGQRQLGIRMAQQVPAAIANVTGSQPVAPSSAPLLYAYSSTSVTLEWPAALSRATDYVYAYRLTGTQTWSTFAHTATPYRRATITGLTAGSFYDFAIATVNEQGTSGYSPILTYAPAAVIPGAPTALTVSGSTATSISLSWTAPSTGSTPSSYVVQYRVSPSGTWTTWSPAPSTNSVTVTGLTTGTAYDFQVAATNSGGTGIFSSILTTTPPYPLPGTPTGLTVGAITSSSVALSWTAPASGAAVVYYQVQYSANAGANWTTFSSTIATASTTVTGLVAATPYQFRVAAIAAGSALGAYNTPVASATTSGSLTAPGMPTALNSAGVTSSSISLSWTAPGTGGAPTQYFIQYVPTAGGTLTTGATVTQTSGTVTGLTANTSYTFDVIANNSVGNGPASATIVVSTATPSSFLIDTLGVTPLSAYSPFKLSSTYAGSAATIRRSSDNTTTTVGFNGSNMIDTISALAFTGANSGYVDLFFDQSGNARNILPVTANQSPQIINAGAVIGFAGGAKPALYWGTTTGAVNTSMKVTTAIGSNLAGASYTMYAVLYMTASTLATGQNIVGGASNLGNNYAIQIRGGASPYNLLFYQNGIGTPGTNTPLTALTPVVFVCNYDEPTKTYTMRLNGTQVLTGVMTLSNIETDIIWGDWGLASRPLTNAHMPEFGYFPELTAAQILALESNVRTRWGF